MGAVELLRGRGRLPVSGAVSLRGLAAQFHPAPSHSTRALLLAMFGSVAEKRPWAVVLCRFKGAPPNPAVEDPIEAFFREAFTPGTGGLVEYWRDASLGAIDISGSRVFGWLEVEIPRSKAGGNPKSTPPGPGRRGLIDQAVNALERTEGEDAMAGFLGPIAVYTQNWSKDGIPPDADPGSAQWSPFWIDGSADDIGLTGRICLTPPHDGNITAHEMGHIFGMNHDVGESLMPTPEYVDPACIMSQNGPFEHPRWHRSFGPALCLPHVLQMGWMYPRRIYHDDGDWLSHLDGVTLPLAPVTRPIAHANLGIRLTFTRGSAPWDYFLEYVIPADWNRGVPGSPYLLIRQLAILSDADHRPAYLGAIPVPATVGPVAEFFERRGNIRFRVQLTGLPGPILTVNAKRL
jgi:hypothetical protein